MNSKSSLSCSIRPILIRGSKIERTSTGFDIVQAKNKGTGGKRLFVPITPMLSEILDAADRRGETVLVNAYGEPFSAKSLTGMMRIGASLPVFRTALPCMV
ncbi:hypothetical protein X732_04170 [Mesorhizobium sp. L2C066B000]|nr:hypothetical protein X732_04170 [Mesorhizobium sp. L2C066B000]